MGYADLAPGTHADRMRDHWWWRPGWRVGQRAYTWHITFEGQEQLHRLVRHHQNTLSAVPGLDLVPLEWLHLTMQGVGFVGDVEPSEVSRVLAETRTRLAQLPGVALTFDPLIVADEAIVLPAEPESAVKDLRATIREGIAAALGWERVGEDPDRFRPHISVAYSNTDHDTRPLVELLEQNPAERVTVEVPAASLIVIHRDQKVYQWETVEEVPIGQGHSL